MRFDYKARNSQGRDENGVIEAESAGAAAAELSSRGLRPYAVSPRATADDAAEKSRPMFSRRVKIQSVDLELFCQQMASLMASGVPILRALDAISESSASDFGPAVAKLREDLDDGYELSVCLARQPEVFDSFFVSMIKAGESTGKMEEVFESLRHHLEFQRTIREQTKSATRYPLIVVGAMLVALGVVNWFVIPAFAEAYRGFGAELPVFTRVLIGFSDFLVNNGPLLGLFVGAGVFFFRRWISLPSGRLVFDRFLLRLPVAGPLLRKAAIARFARALSLSFASGVPINQALSLVSATAGNAHIVDRLGGLRPAIERGENLHRACVASGIFTPIALQMILLGEESGRLDVLMDRVAELYRKDVERDLKMMAAQIEPFLIFGIGILVIVLALGIFLPIWNLGATAI